MLDRPIRIFVLTSHHRGVAAMALPRLVEAPGISIAAVILNTGKGVPLWRKMRKNVRKVRQIGLLGALNGLRLRTWYRVDTGLDLVSAARAAGVSIIVVPRIDSTETASLISSLGVDLGVSLGNPYIPESVFSIPPRGMINIHHERLPDYAGAQSICWRIHDGSREMSYAIHRVRKKIDRGELLFQQEFPIVFRSSLRATVRFNMPELYKRSICGLIEVLRRYDDFERSAVTHPTGRTYTTPSLRQYIRMVKFHRKLRQECRHG